MIQIVLPDPFKGMILRIPLKGDDLQGTIPSAFSVNGNSKLIHHTTARTGGHRGHQGARGAQGALGPPCLAAPSGFFFPQGALGPHCLDYDLSLSKKRGTHKGQGAQGRTREGVPRAPWGPPGSPLGPLALMGAPLFRKTHIM